MMPRENNEHPSVDSTELKEDVIEQGRVISYLDTQTPEELVAVCLQRLCGLPLEQRKGPYGKIGCAPDADAPALRAALELALSDYQKTVAMVREKRQEIVRTIHHWMQANGFVPAQEYQAVPTRVVDPVLGEPGVRSRFAKEENQVLFRTGDPVAVLGHEYIHAAAYDAQTKRAGFLDATDPEHPRENRWLDEGCTMIGEFAVFPTKVARQRDSSDELYAGYFWLTQLFIKKIGMSEGDVMKAYFGQEPFRGALDGRVQQLFGCTVDLLQDLFIGYSDASKSVMERILNHEPVVLAAKSDSHQAILYTRLKKIFPYIVLQVT